MENKYKNHSIASVLNNLNECNRINEYASKCNDETNQKLSSTNLLDSGQTNSKVRRMARDLEKKEFTNENHVFSKEINYNQLDRFNSISDLQKLSSSKMYKSTNHLNIYRPLSNQLLRPNNPLNNHQRYVNIKRKLSDENSRIIDSFEHLNISPYKNNALNSKRILPLENVHKYEQKRPCVIIKETIKLNQHLDNKDNKQFLQDKQVRFQPTFDPPVVENHIDQFDITKYCCSNLTANFEHKPLTLDEMLLHKKSKKSDKSQDNHMLHRKSAQDTCSFESGYMSDCCLLQNTRASNAIQSPCQVEYSVHDEVCQHHVNIRKDIDHRCNEERYSLRNYIPRSTASSITSAGSAGSAPLQCTKFSHKNTPFQSQLSLDSSLKMIPSFARHTESSKRRSKVNHSISIPENLNIYENAPHSNVITNRDRFDKLNSRRDVPETSLLPKEIMDFQDREPEGEYHIMRRWCESLRKYKTKQIATKCAAKSQNDRHSFIDTHHYENVKDYQIKETHVTPSQISKCDNPFNYPKAISMETLSMKPNIGNIKKKSDQMDLAHQLNPLKVKTLETVSEENIIRIDHTGKVVMRIQQYNNQPLKDNVQSNMNRYYSEANLSLQCQTLGAQATCSDILVCNEQRPLRYKRDSWMKRYGTEEAVNCLVPINQLTELEPDAEPPFERRSVTPHKNINPENDYCFGEFLGRGKFGEVKKCVEKNSSKELAAKFVPVRCEVDRANVHNEIDVMNNLQHPRLLQLYDAFDCGKELVLIMELISGGELFERVIDDDFILTELLCELYVRQICEGIEFIHKENFLHLDMKPENILCINRNGHRIKIIDFGLARKFKPGDSLRILFGTPEFVAPEVVSYEKIGQGTDLWSIGVICYVLLSGLSPFMGENDSETYNNINHVEYDFEDESFEDITEDAKDFISKLLVLKPENRMTATQCLNHKWLVRHSNHVEPFSDNVKINTRKLKRFVIRRRWQKAVNVLLALKRMGMSL